MKIITFLLNLFWAFWEWQPGENSWIEKFLKFLMECRIPGSKDAGKRDIHVMRRILWIIYIWSGFALATIGLVATTQNYITDPVMYSFNSKNIQLRDITSPAIIVSKPNSFRESKLEDAMKIYKKARSFGKTEQNGVTWTLKESEILMYAVYDICRTDASLSSWYSNSTKTEFEGPLLKDIFEANNTTFTDDVTNNSSKKVIDFLNEGLDECTDMVKACYLNGIFTDCKGLFLATHTEMGRSFAFNSYPRSLLRIHQTMQTVLDFHNVTDMERYSWGNYKLDENSFYKGTTAEHPGSVSMPIFQNMPGPQNGLTLVLVMDDDEEMVCMQNDGFGHVISIRSPAEDADASDNGIFIPTLNEIFINLEAVITTADRAIKSVTQALRECIFGDETENLDYYKVYTEANCIRECVAKAVFNKCNCNRIIDPKLPGTNLCKPVNEKCLKDVREEISRNETACPKCLPTCTNVKYKPTVSYLPYNQLNPPGIIKQLGITKRSSIVHIFFGSSSVTAMYKSQRMTFAQLLAEYGGSYGLTNGVSIIDLFRIFWAIWGLFFPARAIANAISSSSNPPPPPPGVPPSPPSRGPSSPPSMGPSSPPSQGPSSPPSRGPSSPPSQGPSSPPSQGPSSPPSQGPSPGSPRPSSPSSPRGSPSPMGPQCPPGPRPRTGSSPRVPPPSLPRVPPSVSRRRSVPISPRGPQSPPQRGSIPTSPRPPFSTSPRVPPPTSARVSSPTSPSGPLSFQRRLSLPISPRGPQSPPHRGYLPISPRPSFPTSPRVPSPTSPRAPSAISPRAPPSLTVRGISLPPRNIPPASLRIPAPISPPRLLPPVPSRSLPPPPRAPAPGFPSRKSPEGQCPQTHQPRQPVPTQGPYFPPNQNDTNTLQLPSEILNPLVPSSRGQRVIPIINVIPPPPPLPIQPRPQANENPLPKKTSNKRKRVLSNAVLRVLIILDRRRPEHYAPESTDIIVVQPARPSDNLPDNETSL